jgi:hypothetical protein
LLGGFHGPDAEVVITEATLKSSQMCMCGFGQRKVSNAKAELVMPARFEAAEMPRLDAFDEEFGQNSVAVQHGQGRKTRVWFWTLFSVALGLSVISVLALAWSTANTRLRLELQSAVVAPRPTLSRESFDEESIASVVR